MLEYIMLINLSLILHAYHFNIRNIQHSFLNDVLAFFFFSVKANYKTNQENKKHCLKGGRQPQRLEEQLLVGRAWSVS